jgi:hypothetical protein
MSAINLLHGYPDRVGKRFNFAGDYTGPALYVTGGDPISLPGFQNYIDALQGDYSTDGTYYLKFVNSGIGPRATWKAKWIVSATNNEANANTVLSAEVVRVSGLGGLY